MKTYMLDKSIFDYPESYRKIIEFGLVDLMEVWYLMDGDNLKIRHEGLQKRYPDRQLIPFARRSDCDDIACFEIGKGNKVQLIHDFASPGWEQRKEFPDFWSWFSYAVDCMIEYNREDGIE